MRSFHSSRRSGFTLIEILIVITIILVLVGLLLPAVGFVRERARVAEARNDIMQMSTAISSFKTTYSVKYIPSHLVFKKTYDISDPASDDSKNLGELKRIWPRLKDQDGNLADTNFQILPTATTFTDVLNLDGAEVLVFFLAGCQVEGSGNLRYGLGFSKSASQPFTFISATDNSSPLMDFPKSRLLTVAGSKKQTFLDAWGSPYLYFSTKNGNDYQAFTTGTGSNLEVGYQITYDAGDAAYTMPRFVYPSFDVAANKWANSHGFQITSAGRDQKFGNAVTTSKKSDATGLVNQKVDWKPGSAMYANKISDGYDDVSNIAPDLLGVQP
jgi:prepilin-type N-terminal cleavage/methylation domain-containing protein